MGRTNFPSRTIAVLPGAFDKQVMDLFHDTGYTPTRDLTTPDLAAICFVGGTDINPLLYGEDPIPETERPDTTRDHFEVKVFKAFVGKLPMIGICRGAQLLNVLNGGALWQDVDKHEGSGNHLAWNFGDRDRYFSVTSLHHQMMRMSKSGKLLLISDRSTSKKRGKRFDGEGDHHGLVSDDRYDAEALWYPDTASFCMQSHPEIGTQAEKEFFWNACRVHLGLT